MEVQAIYVLICKSGDQQGKGRHPEEVVPFIRHKIGTDIPAEGIVCVNLGVKVHLGSSSKSVVLKEESIESQSWVRRGQYSNYEESGTVICCWWSTT